MKKIAIATVLFFGFLAFLGWRKVNNLKKHFEKLTIFPVAISSFKASLTEIRFKIDVRIVNPEPDAFDVSGVIASLKRLNVYWKNKFLAAGTLDLTSISIPAKDELIIHDVEIVLPLSNVLQTLSVLDTIDINDIALEAIVNAFGNDYSIKQ